MKLISKRNFVLIMAIFLLFITIASVSATDVIADEGDLAVDTLSSTDDTIIYSANPEDELSATISEGESADVLGTTYENANASLIPVYESDKNYSWHVYDITPKEDTLEFLTHFREISPGYKYDKNQQHIADLYWTSVENGTMYLIVNAFSTEFKIFHSHLIFEDGYEIPASDYYLDVVNDKTGVEYQWISVCRFDGINRTTTNASFETNRNHGNPIKVNGGITVLNSTNITLYVNDLFEDTIYLGDEALLKALVVYTQDNSTVTEGIVYYNLTSINGTNITPILVGSDAPGVPITYIPDAIGDYIFWAHFTDDLETHNFESHSNYVILHVIEPPKVDLSIEKIVSNETPFVGDEVTFTINVTNHGPVDATGVTVTDKLPDGLVYVSDDSNGDYNPDTGVWNIGNLANQSSIALNIVALVNTTFANNTAKVSTKENDTNSSNDEDYAIVNASYSVILNITKTVNVTEVLVGDQVEFTIVVENLGKNNATDVNITDELNAAFEYVSSTPEATIDGNKLTWNIGQLAPNDPKTFKIVVIVKTNGTFNNTATAVSKENETETNDTTNITANTVILNITKTANVSDVLVNGLVNFTITVTNLGTTNATQVIVRDYIDVDVFKIYTTDGDVGGEDIVIWSTDTLAPNDSFSGWIILMVTAEGTHNNTAYVVCNENQTEANATANVTAGTVILNITKTANASSILVGDKVEFTITVENIGTTNATDVNITDELNAAFEYDSSTPEATIDGNKLTWNIGQLAPNDPKTFKIVVIVKTNGTFNNTATAVSKENETETNDTTNITANTVILNITKTANVSSVYVEDMVKFTITVTNLGTVTATEVIIRDYLDINSFVLYDTDGDTGGGEGEVIWSADTLAPNESFSGWIIATVTGNGTLNNTAVAVCDENDTEINDTISITAKQLHATIVVGNYTTIPGKTVTVEITVKDEFGNDVNCTLIVAVTGPESTDSLPPHEGILVASENAIFGADTTVNIENGKGSFTYTVPDDATAGTSYVVTASLKDNPRYSDAEGTGYIDVIQYSTSITVSNATKYPGDKVEVTFTVDTNATTPFNGDINVTLPDGKTILLKIVDGTGVYNWNVPKDAQKGDKFTFEASFAGNSSHLPSNGTGIVNVIKLKTTTTVSNATGKPGETVTLTVKVTTEDGTPFNGDVIVTLPNGKNITVTIKNGVGTFDWTIPKDATKDSVYEFIAYCNGDLIYMESNGTGFVNVVADNNNTPVNNETPDTPVKTMLNTGNPLVVLVAAIIFLGFGLKRREDE